MEPVTIIHKCIGLLRSDETQQKEFQPQTQGQYEGHIPIGNVILDIGGVWYIVPENATDIVGQPIPRPPARSGGILPDYVLNRDQYNRLSPAIKKRYAWMLTDNMATGTSKSLLPDHD